MPNFEDRFWTSNDGLRLHYRDYGTPNARPPLLCLPGLTRNARDFEALAERLCGEWRVLCPDLRGRGDSAYAKDSSTYNPRQYVEDIGLLLEGEGIDRFAVIGTSLGGLMTMAMAPLMDPRIAGAVLNDIGPVVEVGGLERIKGYVGQGRSYPTWMHAARAVEETQGAAFPDNTLTDWLAAAKRMMVLGSNGRVVFDYDMRIAEPLAAMDLTAQVDMWPGFEALAGRPLLIVRGALSDLLSQATLDEMLRRLPEAEAAVVPRVGHAPTLGEPEALAAIDRLLAKLR
jgi:pimeloyl-ACP methyl ester carboxylesterase